MKTRPIVWSTVVLFAAAIHPVFASAIVPQKGKVSTAEDYAQRRYIVTSFVCDSERRPKL